MENNIEPGHSLNSANAEEGSPSSSPLAGVDPGASAPISHLPLKSSIKKRPSLEKPPPFTLPLHEWVGILQNEYLATFIREGGGAVKVAVFPHEHILQTCQQAMDNAAKREGYLVAKIDARFTKVHLVERLFQKIAKQMDWDDLAYRFVLRLFEENGYHIPDSRKEFTLRNLAA